MMMRRPPGSKEKRTEIKIVTVSVVFKIKRVFTVSIGEAC